MRCLEAMGTYALCQACILTDGGSILDVFPIFAMLLLVEMVNIATTSENSSAYIMDAIERGYYRSNTAPYFVLYP